MMHSSVQALVEPIHAISVVSTLNPNPAPAGYYLIGTHDGSFHCDEALAISMLQLHPTYSNKITVLRTRNPEFLAVSEHSMLDFRLHFIIAVNH
jgi:hypothetical protein